MTKKLDFEFVKEKFKERDYELLETEYTNANTDMRYICSKHRDKGVQRIRYCNLYTGSGCTYCGAKNAANKMKLNIEYVRSEFIKRGYSLLEDEYINTHIKLKYICEKHPLTIKEITYNSFQKGQGCIDCVDRRKLTIELIQKAFINRNYSLLDNIYIPNKKLKYICKKHDNKIQEISYQNFNNGRCCKYCAIERTKDLLKLPYDYVKEEVEKNGFILLDKEYLNAREKLSVICKKHYDQIQHIVFQSIIRGHGCKFCGIEKRIEKNSGENHWNWKGGITELHIYLRAHISQWKIDSFKYHNHKCVITGKKAEVVHHLYPFQKIFEETLEVTEVALFQNVSDYKEVELKTLINKCIELHYKYGLGVSLTKNIHREFHATYGNVNFTTNDFEEFKENKLNKNVILIGGN